MAQTVGKEEGRRRRPIKEEERKVPKMEDPPNSLL